mgnify:CR=1 FL=1|jgi:metal-responsive CopG/Arc/MetJ family transcriptional regulator
MKKELLTRTQVLLEPDQLKELTSIARLEKKSLSALLRELIRQALAEKKSEQLARAAREMVESYYADGELVGYSNGSDSPAGR